MIHAAKIVFKVTKNAITERIRLCSCQANKERFNTEQLKEDEFQKQTRFITVTKKLSVFICLRTGDLFLLT